MFDNQNLSRYRFGSFYFQSSTSSLLYLVVPRRVTLRSIAPQFCQIIRWMRFDILTNLEFLTRPKTLGTLFVENHNNDQYYLLAFGRILR